MKEEEEVTEDPPDPKWVNLFTKNRAAANGLNLDYIPSKLVNGQQVVELVQEKVEKEMHKWNCSLITNFIGETPGYKSMQRHVSQFWTNVAQPDICLHEVGYYIIRFQNREDMPEVLYNGPYTLNNKPIILKTWTHDFNLAKGFPTKIPLWTRISFVRMLIEVNIIKPLPNEITILEPNGRQTQQEIQYDWKPKFCQQCSVVGHCCLSKPLNQGIPAQKRQNNGKKVT
ncbi:hypothetical protein R3W88_022314 [Solanum pinnatisectum]|uniref:DUF4283 domain-containing protein n=1 Tax=Solanum pinnatisectum TaxID=50273 RepID=A0AAV9LU93_9SOLN|nr:hypothetical protein R3W88_022314 [Solanum pinnatisectum]